MRVYELKKEELILELDKLKMIKRCCENSL